jgi:hypothetical protein
VIPVTIIHSCYVGLNGLLVYYRFDAQPSGRRTRSSDGTEPCKTAWLDDRARSSNGTRLGDAIGARCGVDAGFFSGLGGWGSLGPSGYFDLLDPPIPNSLLKKPGFFTVAFSRCAWVGLSHAITDREHIPQRGWLV